MGRGDGVLATLPPPSGGSAPAFPGPHGRLGGSRVSLRLWVGGVASEAPGWASLMGQGGGGL